MRIAKEHIALLKEGMKLTLVRSQNPEQDRKEGILLGSVWILKNVTGTYMDCQGTGPHNGRVLGFDVSEMALEDTIQRKLPEWW